MAELFGRGLLGSLKARVDHELRMLARENVTLRRARYSVSRRLLRASVVGRSLAQILGLYLIPLAVSLVGEWLGARYAPALLPKYSDAFEPGFIKDLSSYLIAGQIGILAIVSVAVGVVTLLSERNDGASVNTDIRLYYVESYAYELSISAVALLLVLTVQQFWPFHRALEAAGITNIYGEWSRLALTALHSGWFSLNLLLFLQFITTTLRFVEPNNRERLRERYSANEVIPRDAHARLMRAFYSTAADQMFGRNAWREGPSILLGRRSLIEVGSKPEIAVSFRKPANLVDVRLRPLRWVLTRWRERARQESQTTAPSGRPHWDAHLAISVDFSDALEGRCALALRRGNIGLTRLEKWIFRRCFRFAPADERANDLPTPDLFLEQLVNTLVRQIEQGTSPGFRAAVREVIQYHRFVLAAQNTRDEAGLPFNLAEIGGFFFGPSTEWVRGYRRAFAAAADKIGSDISFINHLSYLASALIPEDCRDYPSRTLISLLELGRLELVALEDWISRRCPAIGRSRFLGGPVQITGSDQRGYEDALIGFVAGWEDLARRLILSFGIGPHSADDAPAKQWKTFCVAFPVLRTHLNNSAYFLASAVWNNDPFAADRFRDLLLRWAQPFYQNLRPFLISLPLLITTDLTDLDWPAVEARVGNLMSFPDATVVPGSVSGILLWELHSDLICVCGLVTLQWYATSQWPSSATAEAALRTLRRQKLEFGGSDLIGIGGKTVFRLLFDLVIRYAIGAHPIDNSYKATIDGLVQYLTNLATPRMIPGRVYGGFGLEGLDKLHLVLLAGMAAHLPQDEDTDLKSLIRKLKATPQLAFDSAARDLIWALESLSRSLGKIQSDKDYAKAARAFDPVLDLAATTTRLRNFLWDLIADLEKMRRERVRNAPLDEGRMNLVRDSMSKAVIAGGPGIAFFQEYHIYLDRSGTARATEVEFGTVDLGLFTQPEMTLGRFDEIPDAFVNVLRNTLSELVWQEFDTRPRRAIAIDTLISNSLLWWSAVTEAPSVGPEPILLVPNNHWAEEFFMTTFEDAQIAGLRVSYDAQRASGNGTAYMGSISGIPVYSTNRLTHRAILCSSRLLRTITYGIVHGQDDVADFDFVNTEDPQNSLVRLRFAQRIEWANDATVQFVLPRRI